MRINIFLFTLYFLLLTSVSFSQDVKFSSIGSDQGLSQASVNCILQDNKGYMWFGTQDGLNKFNGYEMIVYKNDPSDSNSLSHNYIECLFEDNKGIIWVGTRGGGLNALDPFLNKVTRFENDQNNEKSLSSNQVRSIYQDKSGTYWIGTSFGLNSFDGKTNTFEKYIHKEEDTLSLNGFKVESIFEDNKGQLWVGTNDGGLNLLDREKKTFSCYLDNSSSTNEQFLNRIKSIIQDESGILWLATDGGGLVSFDPEKKKFLQRMTNNSENNSISDNRISAICYDNNGLLWVGTKSNGINCINKRSGSFFNYRSNEYDSQSLSQDGINYIYKDREGNIWVGTEGGGVSVYFPNAARFKHYHKDITNEKSFQSNTIFAILQDQNGLLWTGTMYGGITTIDRLKNNYFNFGIEGKTPLSTARSNSVLSLFEDRDGLIWVGTWGGGLNTYNKTTGAVKRILETDAITCISQGNGDLVWIGLYGGRTAKGVIGYSKSAQSMMKYTTEDGLSSNDIYCIDEDSKRRVWIGTSGGGLNMLDYKTGKVKIYKHDKDKNSLSDNTVNCVFDDRKGNLWIGTSNGLNKFNVQSQTFTQYYEKDGLPNGNIWGILGDKRGNLWLSTNKGLSRFNPGIENHEGSAFKNFSTHDGLQGDEFAQGSYYLNKTTGEMFFGGLNGFNSFYPDNISDSKHIPPVFITSFKKFGKEAELDTNISDKKYIELSYKDNFISFEFVALDYVFPEKNKYSYKMEGLDDNWSPPTTRRYISYPNLQGGDYIFRVKASNSDGVWNEEGIMLHIKVIPPWWKTNLFYALCVFFSIAFVFGFIRYRTVKIEKEKKILEQKVEERTTELAQKNKDITSSIQYAKRIQDAILPTKEQTLRHFPESFVLFKPKDIVSGDFYWFGEKNGRKIAACVDCTGHGVPGAFMSMIGTNLLNQIIFENGITEPAAILSALNKGVRTALKQGIKSEIETNDGMDIAICSVDVVKREVQFSSALRHLVIINNNTIEKIDGNKFPIGGAQMDTERNFTNHMRFLSKGDMLYMFSDGYADQFGGEKGKKFMIQKTHELLIQINSMLIHEQKSQLDKAFEQWRGDHSQVDDVLVIGIRV